MQFIKFSLVGVMNTLISEGIYVVLVFLGGHYLVASFVGFTLSVLNAYFWNSRYVFHDETQEKRVWWKVLLKTYTAYAGGYILSAVLLIVWIDIVKIGRFMSPLEQLLQPLGIARLNAETIGEILAAGINLLVTVPLNYLINKYWAFRTNKKGGK